MENYTKGKNVEQEWTKEIVPIPNLPETLTWMHVKGGSKMFNLLEYALKAFKETGSILWTGSGPAVCKTVSCAEIMKKRFKGVHQINKICYTKVEEYWTPLRDDLEELVVTRELPTIHILLSKEPLDKEEPGYQAPNVRNPFWSNSASHSKRIGALKKQRQNRKIDSQSFEDLGLRSNNNRQKKGGGSGGSAGSGFHRKQGNTKNPTTTADS